MKMAEIKQGDECAVRVHGMVRRAVVLDVGGWFEAQYTSNPERRFSRTGGNTNGIAIAVNFDLIDTWKPRVVQPRAVLGRWAEYEARVENDRRAEEEDRRQRQITRDSNVVALRSAAMRLGMTYEEITRAVVSNYFGRGVPDSTSVADDVARFEARVFAAVKRML